MEKKEIVLLVVLGLALLILFNGFGFVGCSGYRAGYGGMMGWMFPSFGSMMIFALIFWVLLIAALVLFVMWLVKQLQEPKGRAKGKRNAKRR